MDATMPPAGPGPGPEPMDMGPECTSRPDNVSEFYTESYPGASKPIGQGQTFMEVFDDDGHAVHRAKNLYYPFASHGEWQVARYLLKSGLSMAAINEFLKLELVCLLNDVTAFVSHFLVDQQDWPFI